MELLYPEENPKPIPRLRSSIASGVLVLLWLLTIAPAHAAPKFTICHKPGEPNQKILTVGPDDLERHFAHGDRFVGEEVCDGVDDDCDRVLDDECCPTGCARALQTASEHDFSGHAPNQIDQACSYDIFRRAGAVDLLSQGDHDDEVSTSLGRCYVELTNAIITNIFITNAEQRVCARIAAPIVEEITRQACNISPP